MLPKVSVVVAIKNEEKVIENCIKSLLKINYPKDRIEIIIATDGNEDRTLEICKKYEPKIKIIETKPTHCKAEALNAVIPKLKGEIIAVFDADCIVEKNCVMNAVKRFSDKKVMGINGYLNPYNTNQNLITRMISLETNFTLLQEYIFTKLNLNINLLGRNMFLRKSIFKKLKGFDENSFLEDIELSTRMRNSSYKTMFEPSAITNDECPFSIRGVLKQKLRFFRGILRIGKNKKYKSKKDFLEDMAHGFNVYLCSLSSIMLLVLIFNLLFFKLSSLVLALTLTPMLVEFLLILFSNILFKQSLENLIMIPLYFVYFYLNFYSLVKAFYGELKNSSMQWYRAERSGIIKR